MQISSWLGKNLPFNSNYYWRAVTVQKATTKSPPPNLNSEILISKMYALGENLVEVGWLSTILFDYFSAVLFGYEIIIF